MPKPCVLIVEDEDDIREVVGYNLLKAGYQVASAATGEEAIEIMAARPPDLILLDLMLPGMDGVSFCRLLKANPSQSAIPIVMLTAKGEEADIVEGLDAGADDYLTKPFSPKVLLARVRAVLRRAETDRSRPEEAAGEGKIIQIHGITIDPARHQVTVKGKLVDLTHTEFRLLQFLVRRPGWVFTRNQILDGVHGENYTITDRAVDVQVVGLRRKLGGAGKFIETVRGVGYRLKE